MPALVAGVWWSAARSAANRHLVRAALLGGSVYEVQAECRAIGAEFASSPDWMHDAGIGRLRSHLGAGDEVVVATATERHLALALLAGSGVYNVVVVASRLSQRRFGVELAPHNYGRAKRETVINAFPGRTVEVMYSDSLADLPLLVDAVRPILVNASPRRRRRVQSRLPRVEWHDRN